jgi:uncharacterized membrane protein
MDKKLVEKTFEPPPIVQQVVLAFVAIVSVVGAATHPTLENILRAAFMIWIASFVVRPRGFYDRLDAWIRAHPPLNDVLAFMFLSSGAFVLLRYFLDRKLSALIAFAVAAILVIVSALRNRRSREG